MAKNLASAEARWRSLTCFWRPLAYLWRPLTYLWRPLKPAGAPSVTQALAKCWQKSDSSLALMPFKCYTSPKQYPTQKEAIGNLMKVILDTDQIKAALHDLVKSIIDQTPPDAQLAVIGIRSRGEILAGRLCKLLSQKLKKEIPCGTLDITLYRDDLNQPRGAEAPRVRTTEIQFDIDDRIIILVDDVLYTGRSARAAMDALIDLGRPRAIRLAVLVDRAGREFPIQPDFSGIKTDVKPGKLVHVRLVESDGKDEVVEEE